MKDFFRDKSVLITGGAGTVGRALAERLLCLEVGQLRLFDNNETELFFLNSRFSGEARVSVHLGDVRDRDRLNDTVRGTDIVFHTAAFKHVILSEFNPFDIVQTNILGTQNVIEAALLNDVEKLIFTSSDKAVNPTNVMGASKLMAEKMVTAANTMRYGRRTVLASTRFGNVLGSRGSVVPIFARQIRQGGPVTLTDRAMTRFIMTVADAVDLVLESCVLSRGGEVFVTKMPVARITDLATAMIERLTAGNGHRPDDIEIIEIGRKPGEKLYEELMSVEEVSRAMELEKMFAIIPAFRELYPYDYRYPATVSDRVDRPYVSRDEPSLAVDDVAAYIGKNGVLTEG